MQAIVDACKGGRLDADPLVVVSNNGDSEALLRAQRAGIPAIHLSSKTHPNPEILDEEMLRLFESYGVELIILAGYMRKIGPKTLHRFFNRIINIHPSLLPKYGGRGMYGINVHRAVIGARESETGVTIHLVNEEYDDGLILAQCRVPVLPLDTPETLAARVLAREHQFFVETLTALSIGNITLPPSVP
jgi:phosphoribosylglycinamide formyltransferase-1